jgi:CRP/FNR family transcriptional regulator, nitrogen oxide reductase regulator
MAKKQ